LLETSGEPLGKWVSLEFMDWLRSQRRFVSRELLIDQIERGLRDAVAVLV
jgi:FAD synthase